MGINHTRSVERERLYNKESVCNITFQDIVKEAQDIASCDGFLPQVSGYFALPTKNVFDNQFALMICEFTAFAAINLLRRRNNLEPLTEISPLIQLAEMIDSTEDIRSDT